MSRGDKWHKGKQSRGGGGQKVQGKGVQLK